MNWDNLLCPIRLGAESEEILDSSYTRTQFQRDYDRIIFSSPFRRLQNKTQVFPLPGSVFVHNRLTHSLEVASVGRSLGNMLVNSIQQKEEGINFNLIAEIPTIVSTACLAHDLGNPPFGHSGEEAIRKYFTDNAEMLKPLVSEQEWIDLIRYEGNANAFRLLTQQLEGRRSGGYRLSYAVLASLVKYPYPSSLSGKKFGFFQSERNDFLKIANRLGLVEKQQDIFERHPLVYLVEAADDICYQIMDIEDAHKLGILSTDYVKELYLNFFHKELNASEFNRINKTLVEVTDTNEQISFLRAIVISKLVNECSMAFLNNYDSIMNGEKVKSLIDLIDSTSLSAMRIVKEISVEQIYNHKAVIEIELSGYRIIGSLLNIYCKAIINPTSAYNAKILRLLPKQFRCKNGSNYEKLMAMLDYISGMTDLFALEQFSVLQGINLPGIRH
ncbi:MAG: deoxyguanosinetriphosphate triphosphohydrolase [Bacteroidales bacterium]|nr:MAG: deoxyguanosinetriphosphate triphosphohydrolase [Bacteroidales bacterium]